MGSALYGPAFTMWLVILMYYIELIIMTGVDVEARPRQA